MDGVTEMCPSGGRALVRCVQMPEFDLQGEKEKKKSQKCTFSIQ